MYMPNHVNPIIKLTEECNYNCYFCRYANHRQKDVGIEIDYVKKFLLQCVEYNKEHGICNMNVIFHGGEPLMYEFERFQQIMSYEKELLKTGVKINNSIQTNASLIDDRWIEFFKENNFSVGISLDGPMEVNGHYGVSKELAQKKALDAYHKLKREDVSCGFLSVITNKHLDDPKGFLDFFLNNDVQSIGLCYCFNSVDDENVNPTELGEFLKRLYDLYFDAPKRIRIREFEMATRIVLNHPRHECAMSCRQSCGSFLTITPSGNIEFCDDYDLDRKGSLGNICELNLIEMFCTSTYQKKHIDAIKIVEEKCEKCEVYSICKSGCMRNDYQGENYFCDTFKIIYPYIEQKIHMYRKDKVTK